MTSVELSATELSFILSRIPMHMYFGNIHRKEMYEKLVKKLSAALTQAKGGDCATHHCVDCATMITPCDELCDCCIRKLSEI